MENRATFKNTDEGLIIRVRIIPNSSKNEFIFGDIDNSNLAIKVKITAQPIANKANKALIELLSKTLRIPKSNIEIIKGLTNKEKTILIKGMTEEIFKSIII